MSGLTTRDTDHDLIAALDPAVGRATQWLLQQLDDTGRPRGEPWHAYRVPYALLLAGRRPAAARVLAWMEREVLDHAGDLRPGPMRDKFRSRWSAYPSALIALAAWHLERYATARTVAGTLRAFQDPIYGGAYAERPEVRTSRRQDLFPTAQLGITGLAIGDDEFADGAYRWIWRLYHLQPELPERLYTATEGDDLITEPGHDPWERWCTCTELREPRQAFYNPGIAAAFLARYAARRGDATAAELAAAYLELSVQGTDAQFDHTESVQICKFGWGAAALLDVTGDARYRAHALRMARWFLESQKEDGHWDNSPFLMPDGPTSGAAIEITAEFIQHLVVLATALVGARPPSGGPASGRASRTDGTPP